MGDMAVASASPQRRGEVVGEVVLLRHVDWIRVLSQGREREVTRQSIRVSVISPVVVVGVVGISSVVCAVVSALPVSVGVTSAVVVSLIMSPAVVVGLPLVVPVQMIVGLRWFPVELVRIALSVVAVSSRVAVRVVLLPSVFHVEPTVFVVDSFPLLLVVLDLLPLSGREVSCYSDAVLSEGFSEVSVTEDRQLIVAVTESGDQGAWVAPRGTGHWADTMGLFNVAVDPFSVTGEVIQRSYQLFYVGCLVVSC